MYLRSPETNRRNNRIVDADAALSKIVRTLALEKRRLNHSRLRIRRDRFHASRRAHGTALPGVYIMNHARRKLFGIRS